MRQRALKPAQVILLFPKFEKITQKSVTALRTVTGAPIPLTPKAGSNEGEKMDEEKKKQQEVKKTKQKMEFFRLLFPLNTSKQYSMVQHSMVRRIIIMGALIPSALP